jgi:hypothetical protein
MLETHGEFVSDDRCARLSQISLARTRVIERTLHISVGLRINGGGSLIEDEDPSAPKQGARQAHQLPLAAR